jgi:hypothetical protein
MKIALCLSGQPRYLNEGYAGIYKNILSKYSPDIFVHTWWDNSMKNKKMDLSSSLSYNRTYYWEKNTLDLIESLYSPKVLFHQKQLEFETHSNVNYEFCTPNNVHSMFYSIERSNELKKNYEIKNNFVYDAVIRCRFDTQFNKFDINLLNIDLNYINCDNLSHGFPNDQFAISTSENMNRYSSVYSNLEKYQKSGWTGFIGERLLKYHLDLNNLNWKNSDLIGKINIDIIKI